MTANRDLKRRVRDRQAETGESYMTALRQVLAQRPAEHVLSAAIPTIEFVDVSDLSERVGLRCRISCSPAAAHTFDVLRTLEQFREMLRVTHPDPALSLMRAVALRGEHVYFDASVASLNEGAAFIRRLFSGLGGVSDNGRMLGLRPVLRAGAPAPAPDSHEPIALFSLWLTAMPAPGMPPLMQRPPLMVITSLGEILMDPLVEAFRGVLIPAEKP